MSVILFFDMAGPIFSGLSLVPRLLLFLKKSRLGIFFYFYADEDAGEVACNS